MRTPPYFNLARGRKVTATSTCGIWENDANNPHRPEEYCKLTGANWVRYNEYYRDDSGIFLKDGQLCDTCNPHDFAKAHLPDNAVDGTENWWQSPPFSRGKQYESNVTLTVDLGQASRGFC